jgi:isopentenyl diphosphate isomerase/L-lactate dehydrogenase-like FMN-dependent dehydrogenase
MAADKRFLTIHEIVKKARLRLNQTSWDYLIGGTETETTLKRNRSSLERLALRPKVLNDVSSVDASGEFFGEKVRLPVCLAPIGSLQVFEAGGGASASVAAGEFGVANMASSVCEPSLEEIAAASGSPKVYQLYVRGDEDWTDAVIERAIASGYKAFCLTVDTAVVSRRERDMAKRVVPTSMPADPGDIVYQARLNWGEVERIRTKYDIPLVLKGINRADDAVRAVNAGVDVVYISNHGGRQLDHGPGSIDLLPEIREAIGSDPTIAIDGGFYRGTDILKAKALGADWIGLGRLEAWSMAAGGAPAVVRALEILEDEVHESMALCGVRNWDELDASFISPAEAVDDPGLSSAFPLLDVTDPGY